MHDKTYLAIDLKSFYASVECVERNLNPATTNLVVADESRTDKTICLAASLSLKSFGVPGRARLFEAKEKIRDVNEKRRIDSPKGKLDGESYNLDELTKDPSLAVSFIVAKPRMALYIRYSTDIYKIYLKYAAPCDVHVYSIDEIFIDATPYLSLYGITAHEMAKEIIQDIRQTTGIIATAGIGTNMYLCKVALDIMAKHVPADEDGVRIAELDEASYRDLWSHTPITDFWRVGKGTARRLEQVGIYTMGDIARCSLGKHGDYYNEDLLYGMFGINAELLIDHAWGYETCTIADIKAYRPSKNSLGSGQVLQSPYGFEKGKIVVREMADSLAMELFEKKMATNQIVLTIGYESTDDYAGKSFVDRYGRKVPAHAHGTKNLGGYTSSSRLIRSAAERLYDENVDRNLAVRRINITAENVIPESEANGISTSEQMDLFTDYADRDKNEKARGEELEKEKRLQDAELSIRKKYGKNALLKGTDFQEGATARERNEQIGGHRK